MKKESRKKRISRAAWRQAVVCVCLAAVFLPAAGMTGCADKGSAVVIQAESREPEKTGQETSSDAEQSPEESMETAVAPSVSYLCVHVCGQVNHPGVYELAQGSRVWDAVEAAGGFTEEADPEAVNLAAPVSDGSKITIPSQGDQGEQEWYEEAGERKENAGGVSGLGLVDINYADVNQLMTVPGIGQVRAEAVVAYRKEHGSFETIEDIMKVTGIKEGLFAKIRDYITVGG